MRNPILGDFFPLFAVVALVGGFQNREVYIGRCIEDRQGGDSMIPRQTSSPSPLTHCFSRIERFKHMRCCWSYFGFFLPEFII